MSVAAALLPSPGSRPTSFRPDLRDPMIQPEVSWMRAPARSSAADASLVQIGRWARSGLLEPTEHVTDHEELAYTISYCMRHQQVRLTSGKRVLIPSAIAAGHALVQSPTADVRRGEYRSGYHVVRIYLSSDMIADSYEDATGEEAPNEPLRFDAYVTNDRILGDLVRAIANVDEVGCPLGSAFVDGVGTALAARLVALSLPCGHSAEKGPTPLPKWRLKKVVEYIEEHFKEPLYLRDLCTVVGLSQTHFTRQFSVATGLSPNAFVLKRRVEEAQDLLLDHETSIASIALTVGFSDQAHFSTVFKRIVGVSPRQWRIASLSH